MASYNAGIVTAYGAAVRGGYTGTYEQFCSQQANYAQTAAEVEQAKQDAQAAVQQAQDIADSIPEDYSQLSDDVSDLKDDLYNTLVTETASGSIASFSDGADNVPVKSLSVAIEPVQDLHGQDAPYPAGGGKNKVNITKTTTTVNGVTFTVNGDGSVTASGTATANAIFNLTDSFDLPSGTYTLSGCPSGGGNDSYRLDFYYDNNTQSAIDTGSGAVFTSSTAVTGFVRIRIQSGATVSKTFWPQIESGSTATSYAPYENICPISGHTSAVVTRCGVNLFDKSNTANILNNADMSDDNTIGYGSQRCIVFIPCKPNRTYTASRKAVLTNDRFAIGYTTELPAFGVAVANITRAPNSQTVGNLMSLSVTTGSDAKYVVVWAYWDNATDALDDLQIELGSNATAYEPYNGQTVTIDLNSTVYGGTLNAGTGVLTVDRAGAVLNDPDKWIVSPSDTTTYQYEVAFSDRKFYANSFTGLTCSMMPVNSNTVRYTARWLGSRDAIFGLAFNATTPELTLSDVKALASNGDISIAYDIEPQTIQLTAQEVRTLLGQNNVFADAVDVSVEYRADTKLYIQKVLNA